ncbi:MAG: isochorismate synthase [Aphanocapsa feldmannii 288cV]|nr:MAG: isochorismate synthase [Aphanocapsa feldmannii 288cV]
MAPQLSFAELLDQARWAAAALADDAVLCLGLPLDPLDPLAALPMLPLQQSFRNVWDGAPGLTVVATGVEQSLEMRGPRRFPLAQRFVNATLQRVLRAHHCDWAPSRPRVCLAFSFFDQVDGEGPAGVTAVLPRWQLARQGRRCWLLLLRAIGGDVTARSMAEELWEQSQRLEAPSPHPLTLPAVVHRDQDWLDSFCSGVSQALELISCGELRKLVLAARQDLLLDAPLDPLTLLHGLRLQQPGSCRFLWQDPNHPAAGMLVGASPERLMELRVGRLRCDALAGTAPTGPSQRQLLLGSRKDRHEHELVVEEMVRSLQQLGLRPKHRPMPRIARHGGLLHLHTPITAPAGKVAPLALAAGLHPTPAVAGLPRREALGWLRSLEGFKRGLYAAPVGWVDACGDADLRVAIRSGLVRGHRLTLTAGAGIVAGSDPERESREVELKLSVLQRSLGRGLPTPERCTASAV